VFFLQFLAAAHISSVNYAKWLEIDLDNLGTKFLAQNVHV